MLIGKPNKFRLSAAAGVVVVALMLVLRPEAVGAVGQTVALSKATGIAPAGETITVNGSGFDGTQGVYVQYCAQPSGAVGTAAGRASQCRTAQTAPNTWWVHPAPLSTPNESEMSAGGSFSVSFLIEPTITAGGTTIDCKVSVCGVFTRRDHNGGAADYSKDNFVPVSFATTGTPTTATTAPTATTATTATTAPTVTTATTATTVATTTAVTTPTAVLPVVK